MYRTDTHSNCNFDPHPSNTALVDVPSPTALTGAADSSKSQYHPAASSSLRQDVPADVNNTPMTDVSTCSVSFTTPLAAT